MDFVLALCLPLAVCDRSRSADPNEMSFYAGPGAIVLAGIEDGAGTFHCSSLVI